MAKLNNTQIQELKDIINEYNNVYDDFNRVQAELDNLQIASKALCEKLDLLRTSEKQWLLTTSTDLNISIDELLNQIKL